MTPDVNILVAAFRKDHSHHVVARRWLTATLRDGRPGNPLRLLPSVIAGFLRLVTNPRVFAQADPVEHAVAFIDALIDAPNVEMVAVGEEWPQFRQLCLDGNLQGNAIPDAWLAATVLRTGGHLVTFDADFKKLLRREQLTLLAAT
jgi:hypothetical protein